MIQTLQEQWQKLLRAWMEMDGATLETLLSVRPETTWIGPSPQALWQGRTAILAGLRSAALGRDLVMLETRHLDVQANAEWGWVLYVGAVGERLLRVSTFWVREGDVWRVRLLHADWSAAQTGDLLTGTRQTMLTWARLIENPAQLPLAYRAVLAERFGAEMPSAFMVLVPAFENEALALPERVLLALDGVLYILTRSREQVTVHAYRFEDVSSVETGLVLLQSWLTLEGRTTDGAWLTTTLAFSTASRALLQPFVQHIRTAGPVAPLEAESLSAINLDEKFIRYAQESLLPGERVLAWLWRPDITLDTALASLWPFYQAERVNHLTLLTERALILIWDKIPTTEGEEEAYGAVWRYIPLRHIKGVAVQEDAAGTPSLVLLGDAFTLERVFTVNQRIELDELVQKIAAAVHAVQ